MRVLVLGAGRMGGHHARMLARQAEVEQVLIADTHGDRATALAAAVEGRAIPRERAHPERLHVDWVVVATPTAHHHEALAWARAGAQVLVEKPLAPDVGAARALIHPAIRVGHVERHNPALELLAPRGPLRVRGRRVVARAPSNAPGRDVVSDLMLHDLDLLLHHAAGPLQVRGVRGDRRHHVVAELVGDGLEAVLEAGLEPAAPRARTWEGADGKGPFQLDFALRKAWRDGQPIPGEGRDALEAQWQAVQQGGGVTVEQALSALRLAQAVLSRLPDPGESPEFPHAS